MEFVSGTGAFDFSVKLACHVFFVILLPFLIGVSDITLSRSHEICYYHKSDSEVLTVLKGPGVDVFLSEIMITMRQVCAYLWPFGVGVSGKLDARQVG